MWDYIVKGGIFMPALLAASTMAVAVMIERYVALRRARREVGAFLSDFDRHVRSGDLAAARALCESSAIPIAQMMLAGMHRYEELKGEDNAAFIHDQVNQAIEEQGKLAVQDLETHLGVLATCATVAPLLGFAGTVTGMINAFDAIAAASDVSVRVVAAGISEALITTAAGLFVAIPAVVAFNYYTKQVENMTTEMEGSANALLTTLTRQALGRSDRAVVAEPV
jgi:biopolymer transport protein ExbB